jgi:hypothetical protein
VYQRGKQEYIYSKHSGLCLSSGNQEMHQTNSAVAQSAIQATAKPDKHQLFISKITHMHTTQKLRLALVMFTLAMFSACQKEQVPVWDDSVAKSPNAYAAESPGFEENDMVLLWNDNVCRVLALTGPVPIVARHAAMAQVAVHDALNSIKPKYKTYALIGFREKNANPDAAVASAAYWALKNIDTYLKALPAPAGSLPLSNWDSWYNASLQQIPDGAEKNAGIALGKKAADAMITKFSTDGFINGRQVYVPIMPPAVLPPAGTWRPTFSTAPLPPYHIGGLPYWGTRMSTISGLANDQFRPVAPPDLGSAIYATDYNETKNKGGLMNSTRTQDETNIAYFWQETPSIVWNRFCRLALQEKKVDAWRSARLLALTNIASNDVFITTFDGLYHYYRWRPETAIQLGDADGNDETPGQADWKTYVVDIGSTLNPISRTPPLPEYPNPNAAVGTAIADILENFFGSDHTSITMSSLHPANTSGPRSFSSFSGAAAEYGNSRIFAGFNFRSSVNAGTAMGKQLGAYVFSNMLEENED